MIPQNIGKESQTMDNDYDMIVELFPWFADAKNPSAQHPSQFRGRGFIPVPLRLLLCMIWRTMRILHSRSIIPPTGFG